jgi:hypothetical protein
VTVWHPARLRGWQIAALTDEHGAAVTAAIAHCGGSRLCMLQDQASPEVISAVSPATAAVPAPELATAVAGGLAESW